MKSYRGLLIAAALLALLPAARGAPEERRPHIGFLYPAGGKQGTTLTVTVGGQNLRGARTVFVSGEGVTARVVKALPNTRIKPDELRALGRELRKLRNELVARATKPARNRNRNRPGNRDREKQPGKDQEEEMPLPVHPLLESLDKMNLRELKKIADVFFDPTRRQQISPQIAERLEIEVTIDKNAPPGGRELRLLTGNGLTSPQLFMVGILPETAETEINDFTPEDLPDLGPAFVLNGQVGVRDIDRFRFKARKGQKLVFQASARNLVPYLADAVPGWFQAVLELRDEEGRELAYADDFRFDPDPVLLHEVAKDGVYELTVRDAIYRGRDDFVYRITMGQPPFITNLFPLGGREGVPADAEVTGWNLPAGQIPLDTRPGSGDRRLTFWKGGKRISNTVRYAVDTLPESLEVEPNGTCADAQPILMPRIANGRIERPGDVDVYRVEGRAGEELVAEVCARQLGSPLDSALTLTDEQGKVLARNDDRPDRTFGHLSTGLLTHHADSVLRARLPADGVYCVKVADTLGHGGEEYAYRLRLSPPRPDFELFVTPSALNLPGGSTAAVTIHARRADGFDGPIELALGEGARGFRLTGGRIPAGRDRIRVTLTVPGGPVRQPMPLQIIGRAKVFEQTITRTAVGADDTMQAFLWRHLVPTEQLLVTITKKGQARPAVAGPTDPVRLTRGGKAMVRIALPNPPPLDRVKFVLNEPPPGISLWDIGIERKSLVIVLAADAEETSPGVADNLIIEVYLEYEIRDKEGNSTGRKGRSYVGVLPAIPIAIADE